MKKIILFLILISVSLYAQNNGEYEASISARIAENEAFNNVLSLWFIDAETGIPIKDADVTVNNIGTFRTDKDGLIYFNTPSDGLYLFSFQKSGYAAVEDRFEVVFGSIFFNRYSVPKILELQNTKLVLDWGSKPADLDLHLIKQGNRGYHISYRNTVRLEDGTVWLDRDDVDGYGPETITITESDNNANYLVYVHNYTDGGNPNSESLSNSGAVLRVYNNNRLVYTVKLQKPGRGIYWNVININRGQIKLIDKYSARQ